MHPGAWLTWAVSAGAVAITTTNPFYLVPLGAVAWLVYFARRVPGAGARSFRTFVTFAVATVVIRTALVVLAPVSLTAGTLAYGFLEGLRLAVLLVIFGAFNSVVDAFSVLRLVPRRWHEPALAAALALSIAPRTIEAAAKVREAQRIRGIVLTRWRALPALAVPVLETGMEDAVTLAESMDARGHGSGARTRYRRDALGPGAAATIAVSVLSGAAFVGGALAGVGALVVSTVPLEWPSASPVLCVAVVAFALPAFLRADATSRRAT